jgi:hypothetical protein
MNSLKSTFRALLMICVAANGSWIAHAAEPEAIFIPCGNPNIEELLAARGKVLPVLSRLLTYGQGLEPMSDKIYIGITPLKLPEGTGGLINGRLCLSIHAQEDQIETGLLRYFGIKEAEGRFYFQTGYRPTLQQFLSVRARVEKVLKRFKEEEMPLKFPAHFAVAVTTRESGQIDDVAFGAISISTASTEEQIERHFTQYANP